MSLTHEQQKAVDAFGQFLDDPNEVLFALLGYAGCGKSYTASFMYEMMESRKAPWDEMLWLAPTWKATHVSGQFLSDRGVAFEKKYDRFRHNSGSLILTTTQQALGIAPLIEENQSVDGMKFAKIFRGTIEDLSPRFIVIDEVSMLSRKALLMIYGAAKMHESKVLIIGDPGQLPPVGEQEIKWSGIKNTHMLTTIMRQTGDSMIPVIAEAIRKEKPWRHMKGSGLDRVVNPAKEFLANVEPPTGGESGRDVFLAYRNIVVNKVQEAACRKVYGHGRDCIEVGELILAQSSLTKPVVNFEGYLSEETICNQDELRVTGLHGQGEWGKVATVKRDDGVEFVVEYLTEEEKRSPKHKYNIELSERQSKAQSLQHAFKYDKSLDNERKQAWKSFFELKDSTVLSFAHPFAMTTHKSQGSSYRRAFVDANDIEKFSSRGLYVAATRPKELLVI